MPDKLALACCYGIIVSFLCLITPGSCNSAPIIGVMSVTPPSNGNGQTYIPASYVKWVESGGARVIPIEYDTTQEEASTIFEGINGLLFIGGDGPPSECSRYLFQRAIDANNGGDYFPVWGICLGLEWMMRLVSEDDSVISESWDSQNLMIPLNLTAEAATSRIFTSTGNDIMTYVSTEPMTINLHHLSMGVEDFRNNARLSGFFNVLSTNLDRNGREFVSMMEGINHPFYGVQFHPEKNVYEYSNPDFPHTSHSVSMSFSLASFFVDEARKSHHEFPSADDVRSRLIYNYAVQNTGGDKSTRWWRFEEVYLFNSSTTPHKNPYKLNLW